MAMAASVASVLGSNAVAASCSSTKASALAAFSPLEALPIGLVSTKPLQSSRLCSSFARPGSSNCRRLVVRATTSEETSTEDVSKQVEELFSDLKEKWDKVENKSTVLLYAGGAVLALWLSSTVVGAVNSVPLLPKILELVGLGYTGWFTYRYLLFKSSRKELVADIEELKKKITGTSDE